PLSRPKKPYPDFPLTPHPGGSWVKKIRGKLHHFGRWYRRLDGVPVRVDGNGWKEALEEYKSQADDLHAGRTPRVSADRLSLRELCNRFLPDKLRARRAGEIGMRMFAHYKEACDFLIAAFGAKRLVLDLTAADFGVLRESMAKRWGPVHLTSVITRMKSLFR